LGSTKIARSSTANIAFVATKAKSSSGHLELESLSQGFPACFYGAKQLSKPNQAPALSRRRGLFKQSGFLGLRAL